MNSFDAITVFVPYGTPPNGDTRPCVVISLVDGGYNVFRGTTKYKDKSPEVKKFYYELKNWKEAGLRFKTWIDVHEFIFVAENDLDLVKRGSLTTLDRNGLANFVKDYHTNKK